MADTHETDALRKDLEQLRQDFSTLSKDVKHSSKEQMQAGMDKAHDRFGFVTDEIESRPFISMLTAFGVGLLLGKVFSR